jgi:titin
VIASTVPDAPTTPTLVTPTKTSVLVSWEIPYNGGAPIDDYLLEWKLSTASVWQVIASTTNVNSQIVTGLTTGLLYNLRAQAHNAIGFGDFSPVATVMAATVPSTPAAPTKYSADQT